MDAPEIKISTKPPTLGTAVLAEINYPVLRQYLSELDAAIT